MVDENNTTSENTDTSGDDAGQVTEQAGNTQDDTTPPAPAFGDNWRESLSAGNEDYTKTLSTIQSPEEMVKKLHNQEQLIRSGEHKAYAMPTSESTDDQKQAYREKVGAGLTSDDYAGALPDGVVLEESDRGFFDHLAKSASDNYVPKDAFVDMFGSYNDYVSDFIVKRDETDAEQKRATDGALQEEWRGDYKANNNIIDTMFAKMDDNLVEQIKTARDSNDSLLIDNPDFKKMLLGMQLEANPIVPIPQGASNAFDVETELQGLLALSNTNPDKYGLPETQKRLSELYAYKTRDSK